MDWKRLDNTLMSEFSDDDLGVTPISERVPEAAASSASLKSPTLQASTALSDADVGLMSDADLGIGSATATVPSPKPEAWSEVKPGVVNQAVGMVTDIPHQVYRAGAQAIDEINRGLNPFSDAYKQEQDQYLKETADRPFWDIRPAVNKTFRTGAGLMAVPKLAASPLTGLARSVIGHGMEAITPDTRTPEQKAKMEAAGIHSPTGEEMADKAMMALGPKGAPAKVPTLPGAKPTWTFGPENLAVAPKPPATSGDSLGVTLSEGQRTGDLPTIKREQAALRAQADTSPYQRAQAFREQQQQQLREAKDTVGKSLDQTSDHFIESPQQAADLIADTFAQQAHNENSALAAVGRKLGEAHNALRSEIHPDNRVLANNPLDAAELASGSVARKAQEAEEAIDAAYDKFRELPGKFHPASFNKTAETIKSQLEAGEDPTFINPQRTPITVHALDDMTSILGDIAQKRDPETGKIMPRPPVTPRLVETARKRLNTFYRNAINASRSTQNYEDVSAMQRVMQAFDAQVAQKLKSTFTGGDPEEVAGALNNARKLYSDYRKTYTPQGAGDTVGREMQKILGRHEGQEATPEAIQQALYGTGDRPVFMARRLKDVFGEGSDEIAGIKQGLLSHITEAPAGSTPYGWGKVADRIDQFTNGKGRSLLREYFTPDEIDRIKRFGSAARAYENKANTATSPVDELVSQLTGSKTGVPPSTQAQADLLFRRALNGDKHSIALYDRMVDQFGASSPQLSAYKQGLFRTAVERAPGLEEDWGPKRIADNLDKLLNSEIGKKAYGPEERGLLKDYAALQRKLIVPQSGAQWSNHPGYLSKLAQVVAGVIGAAIAHTLSHGAFMGIPEFVAGVSSGAAARTVESMTKLRQIRKQMPLISEQMEKYDRAVRAYNKRITPMSKAAVATASAGLAGAIRPLGIQLPPSLLQLPGTGKAQDEKQRAFGGEVSEDTVTSDFAREAAAERLRRAAVHRDDGGQVSAEDLPADFGNEGFEPQFNSTPPQRGVIDQLFGLTGPRYQLWPEKMVRSGFTLPHDVFTGDVPTLNASGHTNQEVIERAQDLAGMAGGASLPAAERGAVGVMGGKPFYSAVERAVENAPQAKMAPEQWLGWLKNQPGVKAEELNWLGLGERGDLPKEWKGQVTKEDVLNRIKENNVQLGEVEKGGKPSWDKLSPEEKAAGRQEFKRWYGPEFARDFPTSEAADKAAAEWFLDPQYSGTMSFKSDPRYASYQLPGGENYREMLLTMPTHAPKMNFEEFTRQYKLPDGSQDPAINAVLPELKQRYIEYLREPLDVDRKFQSSHWDEPNVLMHMRMNDRNIPTGQTLDERYPGWTSEHVGNNTVVRDAAGQPISTRYGHMSPEQIRANLNREGLPLKSLHLEELQSDWHQSGRKRGYAPSAAEVKDAENQLRSSSEKLKSYYSSLPIRHRPSEVEVLSDLGRIQVGQDPIYINPDSSSARSLVDTYRADFEKWERINGGNVLTGRNGFVPDAPFKQSWPELGLKRAIAKAAHEGYDAISWTPGEQQAARYNLSKQIDHLQFRRANSKDADAGMLIATDKNGREVLRKHVETDQLPDVIGKEAADKLLKAEAKHQPTTGVWESTLRNADLKVGGEGMKAFYDKMLVDKANALAKKYGAKVEWKEIPDTGKRKEWRTSDVLDRVRAVDPLMTPSRWEELSREQRVRLMSEVGFDMTQPSIRVPVLRLTPQLKEAAKKGLPLFTDSGTLGAPVSGNRRHSDEDYVERPVAEEPYRNQPPVPGRAHGGRVVAHNINHAPTEAQKAASPPQKGVDINSIRVGGLEIVVEVQKGAIRSGEDKDGKSWRTKMPCSYGYILRFDKNKA